MTTLNKKTLKEINDLLLSISVHHATARDNYFKIDYDQAIKDSKKEMMYWFGSWCNSKAQLEEIELFDKFGIEYTCQENIERMRKDLNYINENIEFSWNEYQTTLNKSRKEVA